MKIPEGGCSQQQMDANLRTLRKLRAGLHGGRLADDSDVSVLNPDGSLNGNDPNAQSRTYADMARAAFEQTPKDWP